MAVMQAVIKTGGKQYLVAPDDVLEIELVGESKKIEFEPLLVIDGVKISVGTPVVKNLVIKAEIVDEVKGDKIKILKYKPKKRINKRTGHRQRLSRIKITTIGKPA